jgi:uncharacterized protein (TIGR02996 family)
MTEAETLLQAIIADPDDDGVRLVYADWLEEHGDQKRAEFIRTQIRLAQVPEHNPFYQEALELRRQFIYGKDFDPTLPKLPEGIGWDVAAWRRGFPAAVRAESILAFLRHAERLFQLAHVEHLELDGRAAGFAKQLAQLADSPWLSRLRSLEIHLGDLGPTPMRRLGESPHAQGLRRLALQFGAVTPRGIEAFVGSSLFLHLSELDISQTDYDDPVGPAFPVALARVKDPCRLASLSLWTTRFGPDDAERLAGCSALRSLRSLDAGGCSYDRMFNERGVRTLAESPHLSGLEAMSLAKTEPQLGGMRALAESTTLTGLSYLNLASNRLGGKAAQLLAEAPVFKNLTVLKLRDNNLRNKGVAALARSPYLTRLAVLDLGDTHFGDEGARALLDSPNLGHLAYLGVVGIDAGEFSPAMRAALKRRFAGRGLF